MGARVDGAAEAGLQRAAHAPRQERGLGRRVSAPLPPRPPGLPEQPGNWCRGPHGTPRRGRRTTSARKRQTLHEVRKGVGIAGAFATLRRGHWPPRTSQAED